jgi:parallel beta-helix repeat protein
MKGRIAVLWLSWTLIFSCIIIFVDVSKPVRGATTIYVDDSGDADYLTIQEGIDAASDGDTVFVYSGIYYENVVVNKRLNITGEDPDTTIINGSGNDIVIHVITHWVNITGFTVLNGIYGLELEDVRYCNISGCNFSFNYDVGIRLSNSRSCNILNNELSKNIKGIDIHISRGNNISNNTFRNNKRFGVHSYYSDENEIINNNLFNSETGINLWDSNRNQIENNYMGHNNYGLYLQSSSNNIAYNNFAFNNENGLYFIASHNNNIINNSAENNDNGITLYHSDRNNIVNNSASSNKLKGFYISVSDENILINNSANANQYGIYLSSSSNNIISGNVMDENGIFIKGLLNEWITHNINTSNTVNGKPIYFWKNQTTGVIPKDAGEVILVNCSNITVQDLELTYGSVGIQLGFSSDNNIINNNLSSNSVFGLWMYNSENNVIYNNEVINNSFGLNIVSSNDNVVEANNILYNDYGINLSYSSHNNLTANTMVGNGIFIFGSIINQWNTHVIDANNTVNGKPVLFMKNQMNVTVLSNAGQIILANCTNIKIQKQEFNQVTVGLEVGFSSNNIFSHNNISNNLLGIYLYESPDNLIFFNIFINNTIQAYDNRDNYWNNTYPFGGNYWSDYVGEDKYNDKNQNKSGSDGIGDAPYDIDPNSQDNYPLIKYLYISDVDTTPPSVLSISIIDNAIHVAVNTQILIEFNEPMNIESIESSISMEPQVVYSCHWDKNNQTLTITFLEPLSYNSQYNLTIGTNSRDLADNNLENAYNLEFTTEEKPQNGIDFFSIIIILLPIAIIVIIFVLLYRRKKK